MANAPEQIKNGSGVSTNNARNDSSASGVSNNPLREILYLDLNRISSYLSQIQGGLTQYLERIKLNGMEESPRTNDLTLGGGPVPVALNSRGREQSTIDATTLIQRKQHHHAALSVLEDLLRERGLVGGIDDDKAFLEHTDYPLLLDYKYLYEKFKNVPDVHVSFKFIAEMKTLEQLQKQADEGSKNEQTQAARMIKEIKKEWEEKRKRDEEMYSHFVKVLAEYGNQIDLYYPAFPMIGTLARENFTAPTELFPATYGAIVRVPVKLLALNVEGESQMPTIQSPDAINTVDSPNDEGMSHAFAFLAETYFKSVGKQFSAKRARPVIPVALYMDL